MEINIGAEEIFELQSIFTPDQVREKALARRVDVFGQMAKFIQRPKPEDIEISATQKRLEPFWYAAATAHYVYERRHTYQVQVAPEVQSVTLCGTEYPANGDKNHSIALDGVERCVEELRQELFLDAQRGNPGKFDKYMSFTKNAVAEIADLERNGTVVVAPEIRGSFVVRKLVSLLMKTFQADRVLEEKIDVTQVALYYHPVYAVEYCWQGKDKKQVMEFDGLTGEVKLESGELKKKVVSVLENDALFDIGADVAGTLFPGVNVAVKLGRLAARKAIK